MRRLAALALSVCFLGLGSGLLRFAHELSHELAHADAGSQPAASSAAPGETSHGHHPHPPHHHDESSCELHAMLNAPLVLTRAPHTVNQPILLVTFLRFLPAPVERLRLPARIDCRGPPALLA